MADLIDRDVFILSLKERRAKAYLSELNDCDTEAEKQRIDDEMYYSTQSFIDVMKCQPTVDAVPIIHAHPIFEHGRNNAKCSNCGNYTIEYDMDNWDKYCSHCGAKMDERKDSEKDG